VSVSKRVTWNEHDEPTVTIVIEGWSDAFRFAWAMGHLQCDFADVARRIGGSLKRRVGAAEFARFHAHFTSGPITWVRDDEPAGGED
jgi:hypothetical protein